MKQEPKEREVTSERRKLSIVIKDFKIRSVTAHEPTSSSSSAKDKSKKDRSRSRDKGEKSKDKKKDKEKDRKDKGKEKKKSRDKKSNGSDFSLSDEEAYRNFYEYHTSERWYDDGRGQRDRGRDWDRDKYYGRSRYDDRRYDERRYE